MDNKKALLQKIKKLAEQGVSGEKESAQRILDKLMKKYGIAEDDLEDEQKKEHGFTYSNEFESRIIIQIIGKNTSATPYTWNKGKGSRKTIYCECTDYEAVQMGIEIDYYRDLWRDESDLFFTGFLYKHSLFPKSERDSGPEEKDPSDSKDIARLAQMIMAMQDSSFQHRLSVEN